jgi:hypothetical protein
MGSLGRRPRLALTGAVAVLGAAAGMWSARRRRLSAQDAAQTAASAARDGSAAAAHPPAKKVAAAGVGGGSSAGGLPAGSPSAHVDTEVAHGPRRLRRRLSRIGAASRRGVTLTVVGWALAALITGGIAWTVLPESGVPKPGSPSVEIDFSQGHAPVSPLTVGLQLYNNAGTHDKGVTLVVDLIGDDLRQPGWSMWVLVPGGVSVDDPAARVVRWEGGGGYRQVFFTPTQDRASTSRYTALLNWSSTRRGPLQIRGADLAAAFPDVVVENQIPPHTPVKVTVTRQLQPRSDFVYLGGQPLDRLGDAGVWSWDPVHGQTGAVPIVNWLSVEARSARSEERAHFLEFVSGVLFGVAAAVVIVAVQEFLQAATRPPAASS